MRHRQWAMFVWGVFGLQCGDPVAPDPEAVFEVQVVHERFRVQVNDRVQIDSFAARLASGAEGNITGTLAAGDGGVNAPWSWHLDPHTVQVADISIELCDGLPSFVEADLTYWLGTVKQYCPWAVKIVARIR